DVLAMSGKEFVIRYVVPGRAVSITAGEVTRWRRAGRQIVGVWERSADRSLAGYAAGKADAAEALNFIGSVGGPRDAVPYMVVDDFNAGPEHMPAIADYLRGVAATVGPGRRAAYGGYRAISYLFDHELIDYGWQTYAWSAGQWDPRAQLQQYAN